MSAPADKPPATAIKEALEAMQLTLEQLVAQQKQHGALGLLLADCRDTITEAVGVMHSQGSDILQRLDQVQRPQQPFALAWKPWIWGGLLGAMLVGLVWAGVPPRPSRYESLLSAVDAVLVQHYTTLPKGVQEELHTIYGRLGIQSPGTRQGKGGAR